MRCLPRFSRGWCDGPVRGLGLVAVVVGVGLFGTAIRAQDPSPQSLYESLKRDLPDEERVDRTSPPVVLARARQREAATVYNAHLRRILIPPRGRGVGCMDFDAGARLLEWSRHCLRAARPVSQLQRGSPGSGG